MSFIAKIAAPLSSLPLKRRFMIQTVLVAVGVVALAVIAARMQYLDLNATRQDGLQAQTEMAMGVIEGYAQQAKAGTLDEADAKARALATLATMQANKGWTTSSSPTKRRSC